MGPSRLSGKVAIVTGSSRGIGRETARRLLEQGARVLINGRDPEALSATERSLAPGAGPGRIHAVAADVSTPQGAAHLVAEAVRVFGGVDILVANAGVSMRGRFEEISPEVFRRTLETDVLGPAYCAQAALPHLRERRGSLLFVSSAAGLRGLPFVSAYSAAKMALTALTQSLAAELQGSGVHVGIVYVGLTRNDPGKITLGPDGNPIVLAPRSGPLSQTQDHVALSIVRAIRRRRARTVLSALGKLNSGLSRLAPFLTGRVLGWYLRRRPQAFR